MVTDFNSLLTDYWALLDENLQLKKEIKLLRKQLGVGQTEDTIKYLNTINHSNTTFETLLFETVNPSITNNSGSAEKIRLFLSLFKGRDDVFARRWENRKKRYLHILQNRFQVNVAIVIFFNPQFSGHLNHPFHCIIRAFLLLPNSKINLLYNCGNKTRR